MLKKTAELVPGGTPYNDDDDNYHDEDDDDVYDDKNLPAQYQLFSHNHYKYYDVYDNNY